MLSAGAAAVYVNYAHTLLNAMLITVLNVKQV